MLMQRLCINPEVDRKGGNAAPEGCGLLAEAQAAERTILRELLEAVPELLLRLHPRPRPWLRLLPRLRLPILCLVQVEVLGGGRVISGIGLRTAQQTQPREKGRRRRENW